jgi:hypothetical protein
MAPWEIPGRIWEAGRKVDEVVQLHVKTGAALAEIDDRLRSLEDRMTSFEANQGEVITEAKAAAGATATRLAGSVISDVVTRITRIEMRHEDIKRRLPPPS